MSGDGTVTTAAFARMHGVTVFTVWRWIAEGKVRAEKSPGGYRWRVKIEKSTTQTLANQSKRD